ncbi:MAG: formate dehydrogenase accessory sulfurtransferase FdhD [Methanoregula sp.]|uniref:formate dehydrogenase accessory sulfurtransferase FdhD n=1 Tax=Methanoregula sp. TaxID=2052170 RepID=UPI0025E01FBC|nr:formate dehydrogenase accessory sulfurtransferase FdhD [Methanoregula sp.]MCK9630464.1 formate dehydrogenase accessory sulfurtransferase FdhD [Methanoregula sp.]
MTRSSGPPGKQNMTGNTMFRRLPCIKVDGEKTKSDLHEVIEEVPLALFVNGRHAMTAMMSPVQLEDFVTGYLFTEQIIKGVDEIESIKIDKNRMSVITKNLFKVLGPKKTILSGCGGSTSFIDTEKLPKIHSDYSISTADIWTMGKAVLNSELHITTGGIHIVALLDRQKVISVSEDIGRHNALDRVIGYALRYKIDLSRTYVIVSGRISSEMVRKCLIANIPIIVSRGATTTLAVETAEKTGLTVVGFARSSKMVIYTHTERIEGAVPAPQ